MDVGTGRKEALVGWARVSRDRRSEEGREPPAMLFAPARIVEGDCGGVYGQGATEVVDDIIHRSDYKP